MSQNIKHVGIIGLGYVGLPLARVFSDAGCQVIGFDVDPSSVDMSLPVDLVIDHSMTINHWAEKFALRKNMDREFEVNHERFAFLKACEEFVGVFEHQKKALQEVTKAIDSLRVVANINVVDPIND